MVSASAWNRNTLDNKINHWVFDMFDLLVTLHVLFAAESFSTNIAVVKGRCVAPLRRKDGYFQILSLINIFKDKKLCIITS